MINIYFIHYLYLFILFKDYLVSDYLSLEKKTGDSFSSSVSHISRLCQLGLFT